MSPKNKTAYRIDEILQRMSLKQRYNSDLLLNEVMSAKDELLCAYNNFKTATTDTQVELSVYRLKVAQTKYRSLLEQAKKIAKQNAEGYKLEG